MLHGLIVLYLMLACAVGLGTGSVLLCLAFTRPCSSEVEHLPCKQGVRGSNPFAGSTSSLLEKYVVSV